MVSGLWRGASVADIFDELNEDLRAERARALAVRYSGLIAVLLVLVLLGFGGWEAWRWNTQRQAEAAATPFIAAMSLADALPGSGPAPARKAAAALFAQVAATGTEGYRVLARLREAALQSDAGQPEAALQLWDQVAADPAADPLIRSLANLLWVQHSLDAGAPDAINARLLPLDVAGNPWRPLAQEAQAMLALRLDDRPGSVRILRALADDGTANQGQRDRARGLLTIIDDSGMRG